LSTGDMLRDAKRAGSDIGVQAAAYMDDGKLVPDSLVISLVSERIKDVDCENGFILDGFPRTIEQAKALDLLLESSKQSIDHVFYFVVSTETVVERIVYRRVCSNCGAIYHLKTMPPQKENICDACGSSPLLQRKDDDEEVIRTRMKDYELKTMPLRAYYEDKGILETIDASKDVSVVFKRMKELLEV
jgi:adenylate kinase